MKKKKIIFFVLVFILLSFACGSRITDFYVKLSRSNYQTRLDPAKFSEYKGQTISFYSIRIEAQNVTNFFYYSPNGQIGYNLFYSPDKMGQPVSSFFWYALEKTFGNLGLVVTPDGPIRNVPVLVLTFTFLNDQEAKFRVRLERNENLILEKTISISQKLPPTKNTEELEKRAYVFIDLMTEAILNDPEFKREFLSDKGKI